MSLIVRCDVDSQVTGYGGLERFSRASTSASVHGERFPRYFARLLEHSPAEAGLRLAIMVTELDERLFQLDTDLIAGAMEVARPYDRHYLVMNLPQILAAGPPEHLVQQRQSAFRRIR